jgi:secreted PhoX family phosphatase
MHRSAPVDSHASLPRRDFLLRGAAFSLGFAGLAAALGSKKSYAALLAGEDQPQPGIGYGPLKKDAAGILDLPEGFSYSIIARSGEKMSDGLVRPGKPDAMAAFAGTTAGKVLLLCNHENEATWLKHGPFGKQNELLSRIDKRFLYDAGMATDTAALPSLGGVSLLVYDLASRRVEKQSMALLGTNRNCAGGPTPWGTWLSCEEDATAMGENGATRNHGYAFEVVPSESMLVNEPTPLRGLGRFMHEACCVDPKSGVVYMSEDRADGLLYRFVPDRKPTKAGDLANTKGKLQALAIEGLPSIDTGNRTKDSPYRTSYDDIATGHALRARWITLDDIDAPKDDLRTRGFALGAARFARGEGMWWGHGGVYFAATIGGASQKGQLWKYTPSAHEGDIDEEIAPGILELFIEPNNASVIENADNLTVAPWGDLVVCEDGAGEAEVPSNRLIGVTPNGQCYVFANNAMQDQGEFAGACFSPDGSTLFVNLQSAGLTLAIRGPWKHT